MIKKIMIFLVLINCLLSFYHWGVYAFNANEAPKNISWFEELKEDRLKKGISKEELIERLTELKTRQVAWEISQEEWLIKLVFDTLVLILLIVLFYSKYFEVTTKKLDK